MGHHVVKRYSDSLAGEKVSRLRHPTTLLTRLFGSSARSRRPHVTVVLECPRRHASLPSAGKETASSSSALACWTVAQEVAEALPQAFAGRKLHIAQENATSNGTTAQPPASRSQVPAVTVRRLAGGSSLLTTTPAKDVARSNKRRLTSHSETAKLPSPSPSCIFGQPALALATRKFFPSKVPPPHKDTHCDKHDFA